ncbi:MAG: outer membrane beta-barrel family protein, partial [Leeuwenhoekiella sp.]
MENRFQLLLFLLISNFGFAQEFSVKGNVVDDKNDPIAFANILLLAAADSTFVVGAVSEENGSFSFASVKQGNYLLKGSFVGFADGFSDPFEFNGNTTIDPIKLQGEALDTVIIEGTRPTIQRKIDRLVFNVENSSLSSGTSFDILRRTPGVVVMQDAIMIKNTPAIVYINDRKVYLSSTELRQLLEGYSGENVKSVEVITNPPANYDAEGGAVLNIVTSKNLSIGYKGSVNASNTIAILPKYNFGTSQYYKTKGMDIYANYNLSTRSDFKNDNSFINFFDNGNPSDRWESDFDKTTKSLSHNLNTIFDFTLNEKNTLSFSSIIQYTPNNDSDIDVLTSIYDSQRSLDSLFRTDSRLNNNRTNLLFSGKYTSILNDEGAQLSVEANYISYDDNQTQDLATNYFDPQNTLLNTNTFFTDSGQESEIFTAQTDLSTTIGEASFAAGGKFTTSTSKSNIDFFDTNTGDLLLNAANSDAFDYDEQIYAAYATLEKNWEKWALKLGFRGEYTDILGNSRSLGEVNTQSYFEPFPSVYITHSPNENHSFALNYGRRIIRPDFSSLNPYRYFLNENNFQSGNPDLRPGLENMINLDYTLKNKYSFSIYYKRVENNPEALTFQNNAGRFIRSIDLNVDHTEEYGVDFLYQAPINNWWYLY